MNPKELLEHVRRKPAMFWGDSDHPFTSLIAFVSGVHVGGGPQLVPQEFHQFVAQRMGESWPSAAGWMTFIREHTASEREAFDLFFQLLDQYEHTTS